MALVASLQLKVAMPTSADLVGLNLIFGREGKYGNYVFRTNLSSVSFITAVVCYLRPLLLNVDGLRFQ